MDVERHITPAAVRSRWLASVIWLGSLVAAWLAFPITSSPTVYAKEKPMTKLKWNLEITLENADYVLSDQALYGKIILANKSSEILTIVSNGCWVQFVDFHFYELDGTYIGNNNYGRAYCMSLFKNREEPLGCEKCLKSSIAAEPPKKLAPGEYFVVVSFDYENIHQKSHRVRFVVK